MSTASIIIRSTIFLSKLLTQEENETIQESNTDTEACVIDIAAPPDTSYPSLAESPIQDYFTLYDESAARDAGYITQQEYEGWIDQVRELVRYMISKGMNDALKQMSQTDWEELRPTAPQLVELLTSPEEAQRGRGVAITRKPPNNFPTGWY